MRKRGQVSVFVIVGIVALAAIIFIFILFRGFQEKAREITDPEEYLRSQIGDIKKVVNNCISSETREALDLLFSNGGHFSPVRYAAYYDKRVAYLCYRVENDERCYNMMFTEDDIDRELTPVLNTNIRSCVDSGLDFFRNKPDYSLSTGDFFLEFTFDDKAVLVNLDYAVILTKGNITETQTRFSKETRTNFWKIARLVSYVVNSEASGAGVDIVSFSAGNPEFEIGRTNIGNADLYMIISRYNPQGDPTFYFAIEK